MKKIGLQWLGYLCMLLGAIACSDSDDGQQSWDQLILGEWQQIRMETSENGMVDNVAAGDLLFYDFQDAERGVMDFFIAEDNRHSRTPFSYRIDGTTLCFMGSGATWYYTIVELTERRLRLSETRGGQTVVLLLERVDR